MTSHDDWAADFKPVPPGKGQHDWRLSTAAEFARCEKCKLMLRASLSQLQRGYAVSADLVLARTGERYDAAKHGRCAL